MANETRNFEIGGFSVGVSSEDERFTRFLNASERAAELDIRMRTAKDLGEAISAASVADVAAWNKDRVSSLIGNSAEFTARTEVTSAEIACPFRTILSWWAESRGSAVVHAAAVSILGRGVVIFGRSGSGKSTLAGACVSGGMELLADDAIMVKGVTANSMFRSMKLSEGIPGMADSGLRHRGKSVFDVETVGSSELRAAVLTDWRGNAGIRKISPFEVLTEAASGAVGTGLSGVGRPGRTTLSVVSELLRSIPCYRISTGGVPEHGASMLEGLL